MADRFQIGMTNFDEIYSEEISVFFQYNLSYVNQIFYLSQIAIIYTNLYTNCLYTSLVYNLL